MTAVTYLTRHRRPGIVILCSIVAVLSMLFVLPPAIASAADSGAQAVDECNPTASNGCVNGILQDADKKPIAGSEHVVAADLVIVAIGQAKQGDLAEALEGVQVEWGRIVTDDACATGRRGVWAGGDCRNGGKEVVNAAADGRDAARAIHAYLSGAN